jgi:hypothetical protein
MDFVGAEIRGESSAFKYAGSAPFPSSTPTPNFLVRSSLFSSGIMSSQKVSTMTAVVIHNAGGPEMLEIQQWPKPVPTLGQVLIRVKAFGLNRSEMFTRQ